LNLDLDRNVINLLPVSGSRNHEYGSADPEEIFMDPQPPRSDGKLNPHHCTECSPMSRILARKRKKKK
jgi:hypothetical protein